jgi:hypothetical protein
MAEILPEYFGNCPTMVLTLVAGVASAIFLPCG